MNNLYKGGQCNPNALNATSNQYKRMMNNLSLGNKNSQRIIEHVHNNNNLEQQIQNREIMFQNMDKNWQEQNLLMDNKQKQIHHLMQSQYQSSMLAQENQIRIMQENQWIRAQEQARVHQEQMRLQFQRAEIIGQAEQWKNKLNMQQNFKKQTISYEEQQKNIMNSSSSMLETMMNDSDPRFQNSQFLKFLNRINKGQIKIVGKQMHEVSNQSNNEDKMQSGWNQAEKQYTENLKKMQQTYTSSQQLVDKNEKSYEQNWQQKLEQYEKQYADHENFEKMLEQKYMEVLKQMNLDLTQAWSSATNLQQELVHGEMKKQYKFAQNNPFLHHAAPKQLAITLINDGQNNEAILALEAYLQRQQNNNNSDSWRILGRILQQNDQDQKSIPCFLNCLKYQQNNLDCLLSLGISCTNTLDEVKAMNYLKKWIINNPKYSALNINPNIITQQFAQQANFKIQEIKDINAKLIDIFNNAMQINPNDSQLLTSMAILFFIKRQYPISIDLFHKALNLDPTNYLIMNKLGAAQAHLGHVNQAINNYHNALDIRPNYVRVWVNIGIAHASKGLYQQAARFYLNALSFRPDAKHVWSYLHTCFMSMQRYDLINQISSQNPNLFKQFDVISLKDLPNPSIQYKITTEKHILNKNTQNWIKGH